MGGGVTVMRWLHLEDQLTTSQLSIASVFWLGSMPLPP